MKKLLGFVLVGGLSLGTMSQADQLTPIGARFRVGYYFGNDFTLNNGHSGSFAGPEFALDVPMGKVTKGLEFGFSPSIVLGGGLSHGASVTGQIYRFSLTARHELSANAYMRLEAGFAHCEARGGNFSDVDDFVGGLAFGYRINNAPKFVHRFDPAVEVAGYLSRHRELSGFQIGLSVSF
jgi:hypothetical protein